MTLHKRNLCGIASENKRKGKNTELAFRCCTPQFSFGKKRKVCRNKYSANEAPFTSEMRAETHVNVVVNDKCVCECFNNLIKIEMRRPISVVINTHLRLHETRLSEIEVFISGRTDMAKVARFFFVNFTLRTL